MIERPVGVGGNVVESEALLESASGSGRDRRLARNVLQWSGAMLSFASFIALGAVAKRRWVGIERASAAALGDTPGTVRVKSFDTAACQWRLDRALDENIRCNPAGTDVVVVPKLKAVYVDVTKAASESIRSRLLDVYNSSWTNEEYAMDEGNNIVRSTTSSLSDELLDSYKFFTFVRNPSERFVSGYQQAFCRSLCQGCMHGKTPTRPPTIEQTIDLIEIMRGRAKHDDSFCSNRLGAPQDQSFLNNPWLDEHLQSTVSRLSGVTRRGSRVPMHFIGRTESLDEDWNRLMDELGVEPSHPVRAPLKHVEHGCAISERAKHLKAQRDVFFSHIVHGERAPESGELYEPVEVIYSRDRAEVHIPKPSTANGGAYFDRFKTLYEDDYRCLDY